jgi:hypothetical protein
MLKRKWKPAKDNFLTGLTGFTGLTIVKGLRYPIVNSKYN